jgi:hypothetical protein
MDRSDAALAVSTAALVVGVYGATMPTMADTRAQYDDDGHLAASQRYAACVSIALVLGVAAVTRSAATAVIGTVAVVGFSAAFKAAADHAPRG